MKTILVQYLIVGTKLIFEYYYIIYSGKIPLGKLGENGRKILDLKK